MALFRALTASSGGGEKPTLLYQGSFTSGSINVDSSGYAKLLFVCGSSTSYTDYTLVKKVSPSVDAIIAGGTGTDFMRGYCVRITDSALTILYSWYSNDCPIYAIYGYNSDNIDLSDIVSDYP